MFYKHSKLFICIDAFICNHKYIRASVKVRSDVSANVLQSIKKNKNLYVDIYKRITKFKIK